MSIKKNTPCDYQDWDGKFRCPYAEDGEYVNCEYWCGADEPEDFYFGDDAELSPEEIDQWNELVDAHMDEDWSNCVAVLKEQMPDADDEAIADMACQLFDIGIIEAMPDEFIDQLWDEVKSRRKLKDNVC